MTTGGRAILAFGLLSMIPAACNNNTPSSPDYRGTGGDTSPGTTGGNGNGGALGNGGSGGSESVGGQNGTGGKQTGTGGTPSGTGGDLSSGGVHGTGGSTVVGGAGVGGNLGSGGFQGTGGTPAVGGAAGGSPGSGGAGTNRDAGNVADVGAGDTSSAISYATQITPLMKANCTSCHGGSNPQSGINLSTYAGVKANASAANSAIQNGIMPPSGALSSANKLLFQTWVNQGELNN